MLFENEELRVPDAHLNPASLCITCWSDFIRYDAGGNIMVDSRTLASTPSPGKSMDN